MAGNSSSVLACASTPAEHAPLGGKPVPNVSGRRICQASSGGGGDANSPTPANGDPNYAMLFRS